MESRILAIVGILISIVGYAGTAALRGYIPWVAIYVAGIAVAIIGVIRAEGSKQPEQPRVSEGPSPSDIKSRGVRKPGE